MLGKSDLALTHSRSCYSACVSYIHKHNQGQVACIWPIHGYTQRVSELEYNELLGAVIFYQIRHCEQENSSNPQMKHLPAQRILFKCDNKDIVP